MSSTPLAQFFEQHLGEIHSMKGWLKIKPDDISTNDFENFIYDHCRYDFNEKLGKFGYIPKLKHIMRILAPIHEARKAQEAVEREAFLRKRRLEKEAAKEAKKAKEAEEREAERQTSLEQRFEEPAFRSIVSEHEKELRDGVGMLREELLKYKPADMNLRVFNSMLNKYCEVHHPRDKATKKQLTSYTLKPEFQRGRYLDSPLLAFEPREINALKK